MKQRVSLRGELSVPGDKSITHRAILFSSVADGLSEIKTTVLGRDNLASLRIMRQLGVKVEISVPQSLKEMLKEEGFPEASSSPDSVSTLRIKGRGFAGLHAPKEPLNCGNSGTTARLLTGILAGRPFSATLVGDESLSKRPFKRVVEPLSKMGAKFSADKLPLEIKGAKLKGIDYVSPQASAQVKSAILLAGLQTEEAVSVEEPRLSRDHTERMLSSMGVELKSKHSESSAWTVSLEAGVKPSLQSQNILIPGDFSAAAFFLVAGSVFPNSEIILRNVGFNPTRIGLYKILQRMGADIELLNAHYVGGEEVVDIRVRSAELRGVQIEEEDVVLAIDEIPVLTLAAACAKGETCIRGAAELRVKESDRLAMSRQILTAFGVESEEFPDGLRIIPPAELRKQESLGELASNERHHEHWRTSGDHRIAMTGALFELLATGSFTLSDVAAVETSFPGFAECLQGLIQQ